MRRRNVLAAVVLVGVLGLAIAASTASALTTKWGPVSGGMGFFRNGEYTGRYLPTSSYESMATRIAAGAQSRGPTGIGTGFTEGTVTAGKAIWEKAEGVAVTAGTVQTVRQIKGEGLTVMQAVKSWPVLKTLGTVALAGNAFAVGWEIGGSISHLFFDNTEEPPAEPYPEYWRIEPDYLQPVGWRDNLCEIGSWTNGPCTGKVSSVAPQFVVRWQTTGGAPAGWEIAKDSVVESEGNCVPGPEMFNMSVGAWVHVTTNNAFCASKLWPLTGHVYTVPVRVDNLPGEEVPLAEGEPKIEGSLPTPSSASVATKAVEECLESETACGGFNTWWPANDPDAMDDLVTEEGYESFVGPADPLSATVPGCNALLWSECEALLEEENLTPERKEVGWETAVITKPAGAVLDLKPSPGTKVEAGSKVEVITNPDVADMPVLVPEPSTAGESYTTYITKLDPRLEPNEKVLTEFQVNPNYGPDVVVRTTPGSQTRLNPSTTHAVDVYVNPADAPPAAGSWSPPAISSINLGPLAETGLGCDVFPFGIPCYMFEAASSFAVDPQCPQFSAPLFDGNDLDLDTCIADPVLNIWRPVFLAIASITMVIWFSGLAMGKKAPDE